MLLDPGDWALAPRSPEVLERLPSSVHSHATAETHRSALELTGGVHDTVEGAAGELMDLRRALAETLEPLGLRAAGAGVHPFSLWSETLVSEGERYEMLHWSMRELARREPTFALHVHVGVARADDALNAFNRLRAHLPLLLALAANSPFWQGRDTGLASARTPLFQAFPRVGIPRFFDDYAEYAEAVDILIRTGAIPEATFLWWDVRLQPKLGTIEVRVPDTQTEVADTCALAALVQSVVRLEVEEGYASDRLIHAPEVIAENRFLAARDGMHAQLIAPDRETRIPAIELLEELVAAAAPHAGELGCAAELECVHALARRPGADAQRALAAPDGELTGLVADLAERFLAA